MIRTAQLPSLTCLVLSSTLVGAAPCQAEDTTLGRLFFTPERRQAMDRQRQLNLPDKPQTEDAAKLTINGVVSRSSGKRTVWINGAAQHDNESADGISVTPERQAPGRVLVRPGDAPDVRLSVGDTLTRGANETAPLLGDGEIRVHPASAARR